MPLATLNMGGGGGSAITPSPIPPSTHRNLIVSGLLCPWLERKKKRVNCLRLSVGGRTKFKCHNASIDACKQHWAIPVRSKAAF